MKRALLSPRAWLLTLLAVALIMGPLAPFLAPPPASADHEVWSATLTVGHVDLGGGIFGYRPVSNTGALSSTSFTYSGHTYTISSFFTLTPNTLLFGVTDEASEARLKNSNLALLIGDRTYHLADAIRFGSTSALTWHNHGLTWAAGDTVSVKLTTTDPGYLDDTFGIHGKVTTAFNPAASEIHDVVEQPDGKIVAVGYAHNGSNKDFALARYNPDGSLDGSFGTGGRVLTNFTVPGSHNGLDDEARAVALQSDNKIVVAGYARNPNLGNEFVVARYNVDGTLDTGFGPEYAGSKRGFAVHNFAAGAQDDVANDVVIQTYQNTERILLAGQAGNSFGLVRFTSNGVLDNQFGAISGMMRTGSATYTFGTSAGATAVALTSAGGIVVAGYTTSDNGTPSNTNDDHEDFALIRLLDAGDPDSANFGDTTGRVTTDIGTRAGGTGGTAGTDDRANAITIQSNGKIVVAGYVSSGSNDDFAVVRYNTGGVLDGEFGSITTGTNRSGKLNVSGTGEDKAHAVAVDSSGKIILAGYTDIVSGTDPTNDNFMLQSLNANGSQDLTFGDLVGGNTRLGQTVSDFARGDDRAHTMALMPGGRILLAGYANNGSVNEFALARYTALGELDTDFGIGGRVTTSFAAPHTLGRAMAVQPDGKIVVAGYVNDDNNTPNDVTDDDDDFAVARYNPDGSLDTSFGTRGRVTTDIGTSSKDQANAVAIDSSGNIVVAGKSSSDGSTGNEDFAVVRYTSAGALDTGFSTDGKVTTHFGTDADVAHAVAIDGSGNIVVAGAASNSGYLLKFGLARYTSAGALDTGFGTGGTVITSIDSTYDEVRAVAIDGDGRIVAAGYSTSASTGTDFALVRYTSAGALDTAFSTDGKVTTAMGSGADWATSVAIDSSGKIVAAGFANNAGSRDFALARYTSTGALDTTFGTGGKVTTAISTGAGSIGNDEATAVVIDSKGRIVAAGYANKGTERGFALARYHSNGSLDTRFGAAGTGKVTTNCFVGTSAQANAMALDGDGKIVTAGWSYNGGFQEFALARYLGGGETPAALNALAVSTSTDGSTFDGTATLSPAFAPGTTSYATTLPSNVNRIKVTPTVAESGATVTVNAAATASGTASAAIAVTAGGTTTVNVVVTAQDGTTQTYKISVQVLSNDATLSDLSVSTSTDGSTFSESAALSPAFTSGTMSYSSSVVEGVTHVKVTPTVSHVNATVTVNGTTVTSGSASGAIMVTQGATTTITLVVTAQDTQVTTTYTIAVHVGNVATIAVAPNPVGEGASAQITVTITQVQANAITIPLAVTAVSAESGDYSAPSSIQIAAGATTGTGTLQTRHDPDGEDETLTVALGSSLPANLNAGAPNSVTVTIDDDEVVSTVTVKRTHPNPVAEGETVYVALGINPPQPTRVTIPITLTHGTSEAGDFSGPTSITIDAGQTEGAGQIRANQDSDYDDETLTVALGSSLPPLIVAGTPNSVGILIDDDEFLSEVRIERIIPNPVTEGETAYVTLKINPPQPNSVTIPVTVTHNTSEAGDFSAPTSITIAANQIQAAGQIRTNQDADGEDETLTVALGNLPSLTTAGTPSTATITIKDDEAVSTVWIKRTTETVQEGGTAYVTLGISPTKPNRVTIPVTLTRGSAEAGDFSSLSSITIAANQSEGSGPIRTNQDSDAEDETLTVALGNMPLLTTAGTPSTTTITIKDDEAVSTVWIKRTTETVQEGETAYVTLGISPTKPNRVAIPVTLTHGTSEAGDFSSLSSITIEANQSEGSGGIRINQDTDEQDETFTVALGSNLPALTTAGTPNSATITIEEPEPEDEEEVESTVWIKRTSPNPVKEGETTYVTLGINPPQATRLVIPVTLTRGSAEAGDYSALTSITIEANQTEAAGQIRTNRDSDEDDETLTVALGSNLPAQTTAGSPNSATITIAEPDPEAPSTVSIMRINPNPVAEGATVSVTLGISPAQPNRLVIPVAITHGTSESGDISALTSITIEANQTSGIGQIRTSHDSDAEDETFTVALGSNLPAKTTAGTPNSATVTIDDDEFTSEVWIKRTSPNPVGEGGTAYVTLGISPTRPNRVVIPVTLTHVDSEAGDFSSLSSITINANQSEGVGQIVANQDSDQDDEEFTVALGSLPVLITAGTPSSATITIDDDDDAAATTVPGERPWPRPLRRGNGNLKVTWFIKDEQSPYTGFDVEYRAKGTTAWTDAGHTGTERSHTISSLTNGTTYEVRVRAKNSAGTGPWSSSMREAAPAAPPAAPTGLSASPRQSSLNVSWTAPSNDVTSYHLEYKKSTSSDWLKYSLPNDDGWLDIYETSVWFSGLTSDTTYDVRVRARIDDSTGAWSASVQGTPR